MKNSATGLVGQTGFQRVENITIPDEFYNRITSGIPKLDKLFGGGLIAGTSFTLAGEKGSGKTTILLQYLDALSTRGFRCGYVSGEEAVEQIAFSCKRLGVDGFEIANVTDVDEIVSFFDDFDVLIVDSFQKLTTKHNYHPRRKEEYSLDQMIKAAKQTKCIIGFICHVTKMGHTRGTTRVEHDPDLVAKISKVKDSDPDYQGRVAWTEKNRFGPCEEMHAYLTSGGFDFDYTPPINMLKEIAPKSQRKQQEYKTILSTEGAFTSDDIVNILQETKLRVDFILGKMVREGLLEKTGRGASAQFTRTEEGMKILGVEPTQETEEVQG